MQMRSFLVAALAAGTATAHMNMKDPTPLAYKGNPNAKEPNIDYSITSPITEAQYPCKGYLSLLGTSEGASVATYAPGSQYTMSVEGGASHDGGSCQLSLSYDKGTSFTVIKSFIGNCPTSSGGSYDFTIPSDAPEGDDVVFAWTWVNHTGNREYYMSCAVVTIKAGGSKREAPAVNSKRDTAFDSRPKVFQANLGGEYCTKEGVDTVYPEPGPDVVNTSTSPGPAIICATGADAPEGSTSDSGSGSSSSASAGADSSSSAATSQAQATSAVAQTSTSEAAQQSTTTAASQPSITGGVFLTVPSSSGATATPTTLSTAVVASSASTAAGSSSSTTSAAAASSSVATGTATTSAKVPTTTGGAAGTQVGACSDEGDWACASDGSSFQRCASGAWSAAIPMAAGTKCNPGISSSLSMRRRRDRVRRSGTGFPGFPGF